MLLVIFIAIPLIGALVFFLMRNRSINTPFITSAILLVLGSFGLKSVFEGRPLTYRLPFSGPFVPTFQADPLSAIFVMLAAFLWLVVSIYTPEYMKHEGRARSFDLCTLLTLWRFWGFF